jgi:excisionase family DNA binding protein
MGNPGKKVAPDADATLASRRAVSLQWGATYLGVSADTLRRKIASGELPAFRLGYHMVRVYVDDLDALKTPVVNGDSPIKPPKRPAGERVVKRTGRTRKAAAK